MAKKKVYKAEDLSICGFALQRLFGQMYPKGLTGEEIAEKAKRHSWIRRIYDLVVVAADGTV